MDKVKVFMMVTTVIAFITYRLNHIVDALLRLISENVYDSTVTPLGIYQRMVPVTVRLAMVDGVDYTNKFSLMLAWKWDFDINGINKSNILLLKRGAKKVCIQAVSKYTGQLRQYVIDMEKDTFTIDKSSKGYDIIFGEICMFPDI